MTARMFKAAVVVLLGANLCVGEETETTAPHSLSFFGRFAAEMNRNRFEGRLDCVYGDPIKGKMCPPVVNDPRAPLKSQDPTDAGATSSETLTGGVLRFFYGPEENASIAEGKSKSAEPESALALFSRCLDDPDSPGCRELQTGVLSPASRIASAPAHGRQLGGTLSPTIDDCGGNMFDPRFCASEQPSVSAAPSVTASPNQGRTSGSGPDVDEEPTSAPNQSRTSGSGPDSDEAPTSAPNQSRTSGTGPDGDERVSGSGPDSDEAPTSAPNQSRTSGTGPDVDEEPTSAPNQSRTSGTGPDGDERISGTGPDVDEEPTSAPNQSRTSGTGPDGDERVSGTGPDDDEAPTSAPNQSRTSSTGPDDDDELSSAPTQAPNQSRTSSTGPDDDDTDGEAPTSSPIQDDNEPDEPSAAPTDCESRDTIVNVQLVQGDSNVCANDIDFFEFVSNDFDSATVQVAQDFATNADLIAVYQDSISQAPICVVDKDVEPAEDVFYTYSIQCGEGAWAMLDLYVKSEDFGSSDFVIVPDSVCNGKATSSTGICKYQATVTCLCSEDELSILGNTGPDSSDISAEAPKDPTEEPSSSPSFAPSFSPSVAPSVAPSSSPSAMPSSMPSSAPSSAPSGADFTTEDAVPVQRRTVAEPTKGAPEESFFCSSSDFACDGGLGHVNICHYTSRIGYRTYCIPEEDSEIVRFYASDYCGPCVGGFDQQDHNVIASESF